MFQDTISAFKKTNKQKKKLQTEHKEKQQIAQIHLTNQLASQPHY